MNRRTIDLTQVRTARRHLYELAEAHPEAFDSNRLPTTSKAIMKAIRRIGRPPSEDPTIAIPTRLPRSMVEALNGILRARQAHEPSLTHQDIMREAVRRFLAAEQRKARRADK